jgi:hypothetical protein
VAPHPVLAQCDDLVDPPISSKAVIADAFLWQLPRRILSEAEGAAPYLHGAIK